MTEPSGDPVQAWLRGLFVADTTPKLRDLLRVLLALSWMQSSLVASALIAAVVLAGLALLPPVLLARLIDTTFPSGNSAAVAAVGAAIGCIALMDAACSFARRALAARAGLQLHRQVLIPAFAAVLRLPVDHRLARDQGLLGRTFEEVERLAQGATEGMLELSLAAGMIVVLIAAMLFVDIEVGLAVVAIVVALAVLHIVLARRLRVREATWFETRSDYWSHIVESIAYVNTLRFNSGQGFSEARFATRLDRDLEAHLAVIHMTAGLDAVGRLAGGLIVAAIAAFGGMRVMQGGMSVGDFVLFLSVAGSLSAPVLALVKAFDDFQAMTVSLVRLTALAQAPCEQLVPDHPAKSDLPATRSRPGRLQIDRLTFSYASSREGSPVLAEFCCDIEAGERVAIVGPSGIGKSTLASLIFAARRPDGGVILLDGEPIETLPLAQLRRRLVIVPHEIDVFTGTVAENIALSAKPVERDAVIVAANVAGITAEIDALPNGYETLLGQGGVELSAGQKQRLGIARAVLRRPDILILDESTSSLDIDTERRVMDNLLHRLRDTTIVAITHRASVVERMDRAIAI